MKSIVFTAKTLTRGVRIRGYAAPLPGRPVPYRPDAERPLKWQLQYIRLDRNEY